VFTLVVGSKCVVLVLVGQDLYFGIHGRGYKLRESGGAMYCTFRPGMGSKKSYPSRTVATTQLRICGERGYQEL
jgi:hypothetical protein